MRRCFCRAAARSCSRSSTGAASRLAAMDLHTHAITRFDQPGFAPQWVDGGFVVLGNPDGRLIALPFDAEQGAAHRTTGHDRARCLAAGRLFLARRGIGQRIDRLSAVRRRCAAPTDAGRRARGRPPAHARPEGVRQPALLPGWPAPRGLHRRPGQRPAATYGCSISASASWSRLTTNGISDRPIWTPDGRRVVYSSNDDLWWIAADGSGRPESLLVANGNHFGGSVTPDGRAVVFQETGSDRERHPEHGIRFGAGGADDHPRGLRRIRAGALARRTLAGVPIRPDRADGGLRPVLSGARCPGAGLAAGRHASRYGPTAGGSCSIARATA